MNHSLRCLSALLVLVLSGGATAQDSILEEVVVTAQKREQSLQDVPISVNVIGGEKLDEAGIKKIDDLQAYVPNLVMSETGIGNNIYIRGIGSGINRGSSSPRRCLLMGCISAVANSIVRRCSI